MNNVPGNAGALVLTALAALARAAKEMHVGKGDDALRVITNKGMASSHIMTDGK